SFALTRRTSEEQFVVFSVRECIADFSAAIERQILHLYLESDLTGMREVWKVDAKPIAQIDHGVNRKVFGQPPRFRNPRNKMQMLSLDGAAELTRDKEIIADFPAAARYPPIFLNKSNNANRNGNRPSRTARFAADDADFEPGRGFAESLIKFSHPADLGFF